MVAQFSIAQLVAAFRYDEETGLLYWKERPVSMFRDGGHSAEHNAAKWNARYAGQEAFYTVDTKGYLQGKFACKTVRAHQIAFALSTGVWPEFQVDHIDHNRKNNRPGNLRAATRAVNAKNQSMHRDNTSGVCGVSWDKSRGKWHAAIRTNKQMINLGRFSDISDAKKAREDAEVRYGFHQNHGTRT